MKKNSMIIPLAVCLAVNTAACGFGGVSQETPRPLNEVLMTSSAVTPDIIEARTEDLNYLYETLAGEHKNLFANITRGEYEKAKSQLEMRLAAMTDVEFYHSLREFVAMAGDAHTSLYLDGNRVSRFAFQTALPFALSRFEGIWHLSIANQENEQYLGAQLIAIDNTPIEEVYEKAAALISHDTEAWLAGQFSNTINFIDALNYIGVADSQEYVTLTLLHGGETVEAVFPAMSENDILSADLAKLEPHILNTYPDGSVYRAIDLGSKALFIQYNACKEDPEYPMKDFAADIKAMLDSGVYEKVIVDLRYNSGGNSSVWNPMTNLLKQYDNIALYCLIGQETFSSGIINAVDLKEIGARLVGTPTGGAVNHYGEQKSDTLPNLPFIFTYSVKYFEMIKDYGQDSLYPDNLIDQSFQGYMDGIDEVVQSILNEGDVDA
jgi:hypothetical protein